MDYSKEQIERFVNSLNEEKLQSQQRRGSFINRKLTFVGALFAIGSVKLPINVDLVLVLYIVPFIAVCFDLYIIDENYGIKRIGAYVKSRIKDEIEGDWEKWIENKRDPFSAYAIPLLTVIILTACAAVILEKSKPDTIIFCIWLLINISAIVFLYYYPRKIIGDLYKNENDTNKNSKLEV